MRTESHRAQWQGVLAAALLSAALWGCGTDAAVEAVADLTVLPPDLTPPPPPPLDFRGRTVYELFVRSFADSDGDGIGDLRGLTNHLDYLNDGKPGSTSSLGVDAVWLMPIHPSPSYHGYDVSDYMGINPQYGTLADFDAFVAAAHSRGIKVVLDSVLNHSSSEHPWFVDSSSSLNAPKRDWYEWSPTDPNWQRPWGGDGWNGPRNGEYFYGLFCPCMPDLNYQNPAVEQAMTDALKFWLARGVDGFRLDAIRYIYETGPAMVADLPETHAFLRRLRAALQVAAPHHVMVGEVWTALEVQASYYGAGDELHLAFSFEVASALEQAAQSGDASSVINVLARSETAFAGKDRNFEAPFLSNHDQARVMRTLGGNQAAARVAAAAMMAMPGTPFIYYGEELGMLGGAGNADQNKRTFFRWSATGPGFGFTSGSPWYPGDEAAGVDVASEQADPTSLFHEYRKLIALRRASLALQGGAATRPRVSGGGNAVLALLRSGATSKVLFVANFSAQAIGAFTVEADGAPGMLMAEGLATAPSSSAGTLSFAGMAAQGFAFIGLN